jgi:hypothetical protein
MIEHAPPWTTNLDQLAWSAAELAAVLMLICLVIRRVR